MKKIILTSMMLGLAAMSQAQNTHFNNQLLNTSGELQGSARFVGMGGAMGALGGDISTMGYNPAGIGLMRKTNISFTAGAGWQKNGIEEESNTHAVFDQAGVVYAIELDGKTRNVNIGFNYQKKKDFNNNFYADKGVRLSTGEVLGGLDGASQMTQLAGLANMGFDTDNNLAGFAVDEGYLTKNDKGFYENPYKGELYRNTQTTSGSLQSFDFNVSGNTNDRVYWGITLGFDNMHYRSRTDYYEESFMPGTDINGDHGVYNDIAVDGFGFGVKGGIIVRPIEDNPLRIGLAVETPTWYNLKNSTFYQLSDFVDNTSSKTYESYLEYSVRTPWKLRVGIGGAAADNHINWDVDYEYANYSSTKMGYPKDDIDDPNNSIFRNTWDVAMNAETKTQLQATHNIRVGLEAYATDRLSFRLGYNFTTTATKDNPRFDQSIDSYAMNYAVSTSYMKPGNINTLTLGMGYAWRHCYLNLAYKLKSQKADFYAFDDARSKVADIDLTKHQLTATLGVNF